jgi:hypothetical protein
MNNNTQCRKLGLGWRLNGKLFAKRRLLIGIFVDEFIFRTEEKLLLFGRCRVENESRYFSYHISGVAKSDYEILDRPVSENEERELVQFLDEKTSMRHGALQES